MRLPASPPPQTQFVHAIGTSLRNSGVMDDAALVARLHEEDQALCRWLAAASTIGSLVSGLRRGDERERVLEEELYGPRRRGPRAEQQRGSDQLAVRSSRRFGLGNWGIFRDWKEDGYDKLTTLSVRLTVILAGIVAPNGFKVQNRPGLKSWVCRFQGLEV